MKVTRYELYFCGEPQDIGFIQGIKDNSMHAEKLLERFDKELPIPDFNVFDVDKAREYPASYFTENGDTYFQEDIQRIISFFEKSDEGFEVEKIEMELEDKKNVIYEDTFQIVLKQAYHA